MGGGQTLGKLMVRDSNHSCPGTLQNTEGPRTSRDSSRRFEAVAERVAPGPSMGLV